MVLAFRAGMIVVLSAGVHPDAELEMDIALALWFPAFDDCILVIPRTGFQGSQRGTIPLKLELGFQLGE